MIALIDFSNLQAGWGWNQTLEIEGQKVFVKGIPLTAREMENPTSTANLFQLPEYYHYGVGSAGFGARRELLAHLKTSTMAETGVCENFPLLYHYRQVPRHPEAGKQTQSKPDAYFSYWAQNQAIQEYVKAREQAPAELLLFIEYFPHCLHQWLSAHQEKTPMFLTQMETACHHLKTQGLLHMDAHFKNIMTDGERFVLTDFGMLLDQAYELDSVEQQFMQRHRDYDSHQILLSLGLEAYQTFLRLEQNQKIRLQQKLNPFSETEKTEAAWFLENISDPELQAICGIVPFLAEVLGTHQAKLLAFLSFFSDLRADPNKQARYDNYLKAAPGSPLTKSISGRKIDVGTQKHLFRTDS